MKKGMILLIISSFLLVGCDSIKMDKLAANNNERVKTIANDLIGDIDLSLYFDGTKDEQNPKIEQQEILVDGDEILGQYLIQALIQGPSQKGSLAPILPKDTKLLSFDMDLVKEKGYKTQTMFLVADAKAKEVEVVEAANADNNTKIMNLK